MLSDQENNPKLLPFKAEDSNNYENVAGPFSRDSNTMIPRRWRSVPFRWKPFLLACGFIYVFMSFLSYFSSDISDNSSKLQGGNDKVQIIKGIDAAVVFRPPVNVDAVAHSSFKEPNFKEEQIINKPDAFQKPNPKILRPKMENEKESSNKYYYKMKYNGKEIFIEKLLTRPSADSLMAKTMLDPAFIKSKKRIVAIDAGFGQENLGGCSDWNCEMGGDANTADVLIMQSGRSIERKPNQLFVYYSQESPRNSASLASYNSFYNMTLGFRHDSPAASPYGYTVKFAPESRLPEDQPTVNKSLVYGKTKGASWFVSHCGTQSLREKLVSQLQKYIDVDIYGACGALKCAKGTQCEDSINNDYHFYMALENSICEDYITEKLWNQGYGHTVIPVVLKRNIIEAYVPPNSFIAFDDYENVQKMAEHMKSLMKNKEEYMKYFDWKRDYQVIYLNGLKHDELERPWGFCQLCRISHILSSAASSSASNDLVSSIAFLNNTDLGKSWDNSCESDGSFALKMLTKLESVKGEDDQREKNENGKIVDTLVTSAMRVKI
uniref:Fucosyltransferase n=1 Tax=Panagrolaimus sp. ES5 TaxID=591445 RepID=A0AC34GVC9_9BILA